MARPTKSAAVRVGHQTKEELSARLENEKKLKGGSKRPTPPAHLSDDQKKIFRKLVKEMSEADILCSLDNSVLAQYCIAVDALKRIDSEIERDRSLLSCQAFMSSRKQYMTDFFRCTNELCLSPQSRAKMANMTSSAQRSDPLLEALRDTAEDISENETQSFDSAPDDLTIEMTDGFAEDNDED